MKRLLIVLAVCMLCLPLACTAEPAPAPETPAVTVPDALDLRLTLPLGTRDGVTKTIPAYTAGFSAGTEALTFTVASSDPTVAEGILRDDGTLYVIAHGTGETRLSVKAATASQKEGAATVSVKVTDARRMLALIVLGVLSVALLILFGKPAAKKPAETPEKPNDPVVIEEPGEPEETPEKTEP